MLQGLIAFVFWMGTLVTGTGIGNRKETKYLNPPPEQLEYFHFGFAQSVADSIWLRWIQDADYCQTYLKPVEYLEGQKPVELTDLTHVPRYKVCDNSWSFKMLDAVTRIDPLFHMPYLLGASMLAILVEDYEGATVMYERALARYPDDWEILYRASYHYQFNLQQLDKAAKLLALAADKGAPEWVRSLASRLYSEAGQLELALKTLTNYRKSLEDNPDGLEVIDRRIRDLESRIQKSESQKK